MEQPLLAAGACAQKQEMHRICSPSMLMGESEQQELKWESESVEKEKNRKGGQEIQTGLMASKGAEEILR